eukprot:jgi/Mesvir1/6408/Mv19500-RA.2
MQTSHQAPAHIRHQDDTQKQPCKPSPAHPLEGVIPPHVRPALPLLMEEPLRLFVWLGEVRCREWVRNGDSIVRMERSYRSNLWHDRAMAMDVLLLQVCAAMMAPDRDGPVALLTKRFGTGAFAAGRVAVGAPGAVTYLPEMLRLLVWLLRARANLGMSPEAQIRYELIQWLCLGQQSYSVLQATASYSLVGHPQFDDILSQVADFKHPQLQEQGCYVLKPECWDEFDRYFLHFSNRHIDEVQERAESLGKLDQVWAFRPPIPAPEPLTSLPSLLRTQACRRLFYRVVHEYDSEAWLSALDGDASENIIVDTLHLMELSLHEEERLLSADGGKTTRPSSLWRRACPKCSQGTAPEAASLAGPDSTKVSDWQGTSPARGPAATDAPRGACSCTSAPLELTWEAVMSEAALQDCPLSLLVSLKPLVASVNPSAQDQVPMTRAQGDSVDQAGQGQRGGGDRCESLLEALQRLERDTEHKGIKRVTGRMLARITSLQASWRDREPDPPTKAGADASDSGESEQGDMFDDVMLPVRGLHVSIARRLPPRGMHTSRGPSGSRDSSEEPRPPRSASDASPTSSSATPSSWRQQALDRKAAIMAEFAARQSRFASISPVSSRGDLCNLDSPSTGRATHTARGDWATPSSATAADSSDRSTPLALFQVRGDSSNNTLSEAESGISPGPSPALEGLVGEPAVHCANGSTATGAGDAVMSGQEGCQAGGDATGGGVALVSTAVAMEEDESEAEEEACALCHGEEGSSSSLGWIALVQRSNLVSISYRPWRPMPWMHPATTGPVAHAGMKTSPPVASKATTPPAAPATPGVPGAPPPALALPSPTRVASPTTSLPTSTAATATATATAASASPIQAGSTTSSLAYPSVSRGTMSGTSTYSPGSGTSAHFPAGSGPEAGSGARSEAPLREREHADAVVRGAVASMLPAGASYQNQGVAHPGASGGRALQVPRADGTPQGTDCEAPSPARVPSREVEASPARRVSPRDAKEDALQAVSLDPENRLTLHVHVCGHKMHQACFHRYFDALVGAHADRPRHMPLDTGHVADVERMEFLCPICRRLANSVLPAERRDWPATGLQALAPAGGAGGCSLSPSPSSSAPPSSLSMQGILTSAGAEMRQAGAQPTTPRTDSSQLGHVAFPGGLTTLASAAARHSATDVARSDHGAVATTSAPWPGSVAQWPSGPGTLSPSREGDLWANSATLGPWDRDPRSLTGRILALHPGIPNDCASWREHGARCQAFWDAPGSGSLGAALREFVLQCHCAANDITLVADASSVAAVAELPPHELLWPIFASNIAHAETALRATHHGAPVGTGAGGKGKGGAAGRVAREHPMNKVEPSGSSWLMLKALRPLSRLTVLAASKGSAVTTLHRRMQLLAWLDGRMDGRSPLVPAAFAAAQKPADVAPHTELSPLPQVPGGVASSPPFAGAKASQEKGAVTSIGVGTAVSLLPLARMGASIKAGGLGLVSIVLSGLPMDISTEAMWRPRVRVPD